MEPSEISKAQTILNFEDLDSAVLSDFLTSQNIPASAVEILKDEEVSGSSFLSLNENDLKEMNIKIGPRKLILKLIESQKKNATPENKNEENNINIQQSPEKVPEAGNVVTATTTMTITTMLTKHPEGQRLVDKLKLNQCLKPEERQLFIRIVVGNLIATHGNCYPPSSQKTQLAKEIVKEFPCLKSLRTIGGYEHFYDPISRSGFIEYRLKTVRVKLTPTKKKNKSKFVRKNMAQDGLNTTNLLLEGAELESKITLMMTKLPTPENRAGIVATLRETHGNRVVAIKEQKMFACQILQQYPRLKDYEGEMIELEFRMSQNQENDGFLVGFPDLAKKIIAYTAKTKPNLMLATSDLVDENMRGLVLLAELLPVKSCKRKLSCDQVGLQSTTAVLNQKKVPMKELLIIKPLGSSIEDVEKEEGRPKQPHLLMIGSSFILMVDGEAICVGQNFLRSFDLLFKSHFVFQLRYEQRLSLFYNYLANFVYNISEEGPKPTSEMLNVALNSM